MLRISLDRDFDHMYGIGMTSFLWNGPQGQSRKGLFTPISSPASIAQAGRSCQQVGIAACGIQCRSRQRVGIAACGIQCWIKTLMSVLYQQACVVIFSAMKVGLQEESIVSRQNGVLCFLVVKVCDVSHDRILSSSFEGQPRAATMVWSGCLLGPLIYN